jgi:predicted RNase H-like HicB family nuclease
VRYRIVYERTPKNFSAYSPDLPGCVTTGKTLERTRALMREAIGFHLEDLAEQGDVRPSPTGFIEILDYEPTVAKRRPAVRRRSRAS